MQEAKVHSSTGQYDRSHTHNYIAGYAIVLDRNSGTIERITALLSVNDACPHATTYKASAGTQTIWNRLKCAKS